MLFLGLNVNYWYDSYLVKGKADENQRKFTFVRLDLFLFQVKLLCHSLSILAPAYSVPEVRVFNPVFIFDS